MILSTVNQDRQEGLGDSFRSTVGALLSRSSMCSNDTSSPSLFTKPGSFSVFTKALNLAISFRQPVFIPMARRKSYSSANRAWARAILLRDIGP